MSSVSKKKRPKQRPMGSKCCECKRTFSRFSNLRRHVRLFHPEKVDEIAPFMKSRFICEICGSIFNRKFELTFHRKTHDVSSVSSKYFSKKCPLCDFKQATKKQLYSHFKDSHDTEVCIDKMDFATKEDFEIWKKSMEYGSGSQFVKERGEKFKKYISYICSRSGYYIPTGQNKRRLKTQGSRKIGGICPAQIKVLVNKNGQYKVSYIKTHIGHLPELIHLSLTSEEREMIAAKMALKTPFDHILNEIRDNTSEDAIERIHLLTKKDLHNIAASFNLHSETMMNSNDAISFETWVNDLQNSKFILFYKPEDVTLLEHPQLRNEDFVLIIMNDGQALMLEKSDFVCIDRTHELNAYNYELHTLLALDDLRQGFPVAFLISNRSDQHVMSLFYSSIKERMGFSLSPKVFMSDMASSYYDAWIEVMNEAELRLFCAWHVDRAWRKNLITIPSKEKKAQIYKNLRTLLQETDQATFLIMFEQFLKISSEDSDTSKFSSYFRENYEINVHCWATYYRQNSGLNTNMNLERMHRTIKHIYLEGTHMKRLDKSVTCIMRFVKDRLFDRRIAENKGKICSKLKNLRERHSQSEKLDVNLIVEVDGGWQAFMGEAPHIYDIHVNMERCDCRLVCTDCKLCIHNYSCNCLDSSIRWNMCKHIHLLGRKMLGQNTEQQDLQNEIEIDYEDLQNDNDHENSETEDLNNCLLRNAHEENLQKSKEELKMWFCTLVDKIQSDADLKTLKAKLLE